jgi:hypothetical protein
VVLCWTLLVVYLVTLRQWMSAPFIFRHPNSGLIASTTVSLPATRAQPTGKALSFCAYRSSHRRPVHTTVSTSVSRTLQLSYRPYTHVTTVSTSVSRTLQLSYRPYVSRILQLSYRSYTHVATVPTSVYRTLQLSYRPYTHVTTSVQIFLIAMLCMFCICGIMAISVKLFILNNLNSHGCSLMFLSWSHNTNRKLQRCGLT